MGKWLLVYLFVQNGQVIDYELIKDYGDDVITCDKHYLDMIRKPMAYANKEKTITKMPSCYDDNNAPLTHPGEIPKKRGYAGEIPSISGGIFIPRGAGIGALFIDLP